jgi:hypothetical protein
MLLYFADALDLVRGYKAELLQAKDVLYLESIAHIALQYGWRISIL